MSSVADETTSGKETAPEAESGGKASRRRRPSVSAKKVAHGAKVGSDAIRSRVASIVWLIAVICAAVLALGALLVALDANARNSVVQWITDTAGVLSGPFGDAEGGVFNFEKKNGSADTVKNALVNWGIAAVAYLVVGRVADRIIRP
ncbi:MAG: hypothetical protein M3211_07430 [Actinomycetota bacterium]|nr:hypothetical protein [Actinomycetota bacterium]